MVSVAHNTCIVCINCIRMTKCTHNADNTYMYLYCTTGYCHGRTFSLLHDFNVITDIIHIFIFADVLLWQIYSSIQLIHVIAGTEEGAC